MFLGAIDRKKQCRAAVPTNDGMPIIVLWLLIAYVVLNPLYTFSSGMPQPADLIAAIAICIFFIGKIKIDKDLSLLYFLCMLFCGWIFLVNTFHFTMYPDEKFFMISSLFYIYNASMMILTINIFMNFNTMSFLLTKYAIILSVILELFLLLLESKSSVRTSGTFNNPNQLGYWCVLILSCWLLIKDDKSLKLDDYFILFANCYMTFLSASRAAIAGILLLLFLACVYFRINKIAVTYVFLAIVAALLIHPALFDVVSTEFSQQFAGIGHRLETKGYGDSADGRAYDWVLKYPENLFFGAGEGALERFRAHGGAKEIHSTLVSLIFTFGVVGLLTFLGIVRTVFKGASVMIYTLLLPVFLYGLTHNGIRFTFLWVFFGLVFVRCRQPPATNIYEA